jgi:hypothetical protein
MGRYLMWLPSPRSRRLMVYNLTGRASDPLEHHRSVLHIPRYLYSADGRRRAALDHAGAGADAAVCTSAPRAATKPIRCPTGP